MGSFQALVDGSGLLDYFKPSQVATGRSPAASPVAVPLTPAMLSHLKHFSFCGEEAAALLYCSFVERLVQRRRLWESAPPVHAIH